jgi:hypothetical protein
MLLRGVGEIRERIVRRQQQELKLVEQFTKANASGEDTKHLEAMLIAVSSEIAMLKSMLTKT